MMKKILLISLFILFFQQVGHGQFEKDSVDSSNRVQAKNAIFFELFGSGGIYSFNYERVFENRLVLRGGISYNQSDSFLIGKRVSIPVTLGYLIAIDEDSHIELGMGNTFAFEDGNLLYGLGPLAGFREQDLNEGGGYFRITFTPLLSVNDKDTFFSFFGGISFGASF